MSHSHAANFSWEKNHAVVARALYDIGSLHDSKRNFSKAMHYYHRALSIYKEKYAQNLRQRFCFGFDRASTVRELIGTSSDEMEILSSGDEIIVSSSAETPESKIREQYSLVTMRFRMHGGKTCCGRGNESIAIGTIGGLPLRCLFSV